jgi:hypothetical protein
MVVGQIVFGQIDVGQIVFGQINFGQINFGQIVVGQIDVGQIDVRQIVVGQIVVRTKTECRQAQLSASPQNETKLEIWKNCKNHHTSGIARTSGYIN